MALGLLLIAFVGVSVISIIGLALLYLLKKERAKAGVFYFLSIWGMAVAVISAMSTPSNRMSQQLIAWGFGILSAAGLMVHLKGSSASSRMTAYVLVTVSVIGGVLKMFIF
ncbi:hypothetical protein H6B11_13755 [Mediterraneibacter glycyrrhizinilyticus]|nr:hypothetical protein [Mediterraneibacter glycyrrhizinilyticus]MBM6855199.1 hypothetical protein [Mediterraneibacter glycyrrhizinilyticus]